MNKTLARLLYLFRYLWATSPQQMSNRVARVFNVHQPKDPKPWSSGKHKRWTRLPYFLEMFRMAAEEAGHQLHFRDKVIAEIGAGPALGFLPLLLAEGAARGSIIEPQYTECRHDRQFHDTYLMPLFQTHSRMVSKHSDITYDQFIAKIMAIEIYRDSIEKRPQDMGEHHVILSKSCLEYVQDIGAAVRNIAAISSDGSINVHYIDFTMHFPKHRTGTPFGATYERSKAVNPEYYKNPGGILNLQRKNDFMRQFAKYFREVYFTPLVEYSDYLRFDNMHSDWADYERDDLATANGILLAVK